VVVRRATLGRGNVLVTGGQLPRTAKLLSALVPGHKKNRYFLRFFACTGRPKFLIRAQSSDFLTKIENRNNNKHQGNRIMANALSKSQLAAAIAEKAEISKKQAVEILDHVATLAYKHAKDTFTLPGIGKLVLKNRAARLGRNPKTGETIQIPAKRVVKFRVAKAAKDAILGGK
jgi:DNA-binding protein HU-beta